MNAEVLKFESFAASGDAVGQTRDTQRLVFPADSPLLRSVEAQSAPSAASMRSLPPATKGPGIATMGQAPAAEGFKRRLAAIAFADVAGFSGRIEVDDVAAMQEWKRARIGIIEPSIRAHGGQLLRIVGDGLFIEFGSATDAVRWATEVQDELAHADVSASDERLALRIGINVDDVLVDEGELHGDGVNIAARIHQMAAPGDIVVTAAVRDYAMNRLDVAFDDLGEHMLKNISHPVRVSRVVASNSVGVQARAAKPKAGDDRMRRLPTVAVLPFRTLGATTDEDYFGEGITEDIIGALSRTKAFFVIARSSTLGYSPEQDSAARAARELGVRYLLLGSVRRRANTLRISTKLVDASGGVTLWANNYDGSIEELFDFQDKIVASIVATIEPHVLSAETARAQSKPTDSLDAYDCVLRSLPLVQRIDHPRWGEAAALLARAIELDPFYAQAHAHRAWLHLLMIGEALSTDIASDTARAHELVDRAMLLDPNDPFVLAVAAHVYSFLLRQPERALGLVHRAIELNDGSAFAWGIGALTHVYLSHSEAALAHFARAHALSPFDPYNNFFFVAASMAELVRGNFEEATRWAREALRWNPRFVPTHRHLATALANSGLIDEARSVARDMLALSPDFRVSAFASWYPLRPQASLDIYLRGLRLAGLPE